MKNAIGELVPTVKDYLQDKIETYSEIILKYVKNTATDFNLQLTNMTSMAAPLAIVALANGGINVIEAAINTSPFSVLMEGSDLIMTTTDKNYETLRPYIPKDGQFFPLFEMCFREPERYRGVPEPEANRSADDYKKVLRLLCKTQIGILTTMNIFGDSIISSALTTLSDPLQNFVAISSFMHGLVYALDNNYNSPKCGSLKAFITGNMLQGFFGGLNKNV